MPDSRPNHGLHRTPIAIVGIAGMFPEARTIREFWRNVVAGRDCIKDVPAAWWRIADHYDPDMFAEDATYARKGGFLPPVTFDPLEFGMPPAVLDSTGAVQLLSLIVARDVLRDAGCDSASWYDPDRTGVVLGVCGTNSTMLPLGARLLAPQVRDVALSCGLSDRDAQEVVRRFKAASPPWTEDSFPGVLGNVVSGRIANRLGLGAANHTVDAACASSLAAVRGAVDELVAHRADLMITGGCDADNTIMTYLCFSKTPALSPTDRIRPFDRGADGTMLGEGIGMLALKRLVDAERDNDRIYAVLRGLGSSSDGRTKSIYAPCGDGQLVALRRAYEDAAASPASVELVEAHGTGTPVGDGVELGALAALVASDKGPAHIAVGTVKSQIGHTKAAAGAAGLIKAALALHHRVLPPTINVDAPAEGAAGALYVNTRARPWVRDPGRPARRAGVSAFGFGGVNFHAVLEEHASAPRILHSTPVTCLWHAPDPSHLLDLLVGDTPPWSGDEPIPATHARVGFVAADQAKAAELRSTAAAQLRAHPGHESWEHASGIHYRRAALEPEAKVAALFAGQGSQYVDMGLSALLALPPVRAAFDAANAQCPPGNESLARVVFPAPGSVDPAAAESRLRRTSHAQLAIGALSAGQYAYLAELGFVPDALLGHSFGELTALWAAGALDEPAFLRLARARGLAMEAHSDRDPGAMVAVRAPAAVWGELRARFPALTVCNHNSPEDFVVGGPTADIEDFLAACMRERIPAQRLAVAAAFHTELIRHALDPFSRAVAREVIQPPALSVSANTAGASYCTDPAENARTLVGQIISPVDFVGRLHELYESGCRVFVEFGPRQVLTQLTRRTFGDDVVAIPTDLGPGTDSAAALKLAALRLAVLGRPLVGIDRHELPAPPEATAGSQVSRLLEGPNFALNARRQDFDKILSEPYACEATHATAARTAAAGAPGPAFAHGPDTASTDAPGPTETVGSPSPEAVPEGSVPTGPAPLSGLADAAAAHLALHNRFLDGQLRTTERLVGLLASSDDEKPHTTARVTAVRDHSMALSEAHIRANEVLGSLLRLSLGAGPDSPARAALAVPRAQGAEQTTPQVPPAPGEPHADTRMPQYAQPAAPAEPALSAPGVSPAHTPRVPAARSAIATFLDPGQAAAEGASDDRPVLDRDHVEQVVREIIAEKTGYAVEMLEPDLDIQADLGIDSLKQVEIAAEAWRRYPVIPREEIYRFAQARTIQDLSLVLEEIAAAPTGDLGQFTTAPLGRAHIGLRPLPAPDEYLRAYAPDHTAVVIDDGSSLSATLVRSLRAAGWHVRPLALPDVTVTGDDVALTDWTEDALQARLAGFARVDLCVLPFDRPAAHGSEATIRRLRHAVLVAKHIAPHLRKATEAGHRAGFVAVTRLDGALGFEGSGADPVTALAGGLGGLVKTLALEGLTLFGRVVDIAPSLDDAEAGTRFLAEITDANTALREVGWAAGALRRTPVLAARPGHPLPGAPDTELDAQDVLLVTGGARGITSWCVSELARARGCRFILLGRTPLAELPGWAADCATESALRDVLVQRLRADGGDPEAPAERAALDRQVRAFEHQREVQATLDGLRAQGVDAEYVAADVGDRTAVAKALAPHSTRITGIIHGAGVLADEPLWDKSEQSVARVVDAKLTGLVNILDALPAEKLRHLVVFTSVAGVYGNARQTDYALANEALNRFACAWQAAQPTCRVAALAWGPWRGGMASPGIQEIFVQHGVPLLTREEGCRYFVEQMSPEHTGDLMTVVGPTEPVFRRRDALSPQGAVLNRDLSGLDAEPVLLDHRINGHPVLPMTVAVGWCVAAVEGVHGGHPVAGCHDFTIRNGLVLDGAHPGRARLDLSRRGAAVHAVIRDADASDAPPRYEGDLVLGESVSPPPRQDLPSAATTWQNNSAYADGFLFHGPLLQGLGEAVEESDTRLTVSACLAEPELAHGAYAGLRYHPASADLLLQTAALLGRRRSGHRCLPVSVKSVNMYAPLPDGEPFLIVAELVDDSPLDLTVTVTACAPDGAVLQRWESLKMIVAAPELVARAAWPAAEVAAG
ncbi:SDR family NAD(P)-dependent oxidoreductase [Streptomyces sp. BP-8]|uniref:SDR family NAD(P)-dependent oxidoreductase n=1 Tax=Streptomyces sirii TaxID=3127701 RepID=UPI00388F5328